MDKSFSLLDYIVFISEKRLYDSIFPLRAGRHRSLCFLICHTQLFVRSLTNMWQMTPRQEPNRHKTNLLLDFFSFTKFTVIFRRLFLKYWHPSMLLRTNPCGLVSTTLGSRLFIPCTLPVLDIAGTQCWRFRARMKRLPWLSVMCYTPVLSS